MGKGSARQCPTQHGTGALCERSVEGDGRPNHSNSDLKSCSRSSSSRSRSRSSGGGSGSGESRFLGLGEGDANNKSRLSSLWLFHSEPVPETRRREQQVMTRKGSFAIANVSTLQELDSRMNSSLFPASRSRTKASRLCWHYKAMCEQQQQQELCFSRFFFDR